MARIAAQGSFKTPSSRNAPKSIRNEVQTKAPVLDEQALLTERGMRQTFLNNTAVNEDRFKNDLSAIAGYPEGRVVKVTYFSLDAPLTDSRSHMIDVLTDTKDNVHLSFTQIRNFELRLKEEFSYEYNEEDNLSSVHGTALVFAGFVPHIHDGFLYELRNGKIGYFEVSNARRLAIGQDTYHEISFALNAYLDASMRDTLNKQSSSVAYFDKVKFLVGNHALLNSESYLAQKDLDHLRAELVRNYVDRFYQPKFSSFMRPDGVYDPYVVEYWNRKVNFDQCNDRPSQLFIAVQGYKRTIWSLLTGNPIRNLKNLCQHWATTTLYQTFWSVNQTALLNRDYLYIKDETGRVPNPTINKNGEPILLDVSPIFHAPIDPDLVQDQIDKDFERFKRNNGGEFPNQVCPPSVHYTYDPHYQPEECKGCGVRECEWATHRGDATDALNFLVPPYPIISNEHLFDIWVKINKYPKDKIYTAEEMSKFQGYLEWYRETYEGTLSRSELKKQWLEAANLPEDHENTPEEEAALIEYIKSYRANYLPVLTDRQIEVIWRIQTGVALNGDLDAGNIVRLGLVIADYRKKHGNPPDDGYTTPFAQIGRPITAEEVSAAKAVMYADVIKLDPPTLKDIDDGENNVLPQPVDPFPSEDVPQIFKPQLRGYHFCPSHCYYKCGPSVRKVVSKENDTDTSSYVLSNEFYLGSTAMDPFERLIYDAITNKEVSPVAIRDAVSTYLDWDDETAFYRILLSLYLVDYALRWIMYHS